MICDLREAQEMSSSAIYRLVCVVNYDGGVRWVLRTHI
jgi:hypothetical protein